MGDWDMGLPGYEIFGQATPRRRGEMGLDETLVFGCAMFGFVVTPSGGIRAAQTLRLKAELRTRGLISSYSAFRPKRMVWLTPRSSLTVEGLVRSSTFSPWEMVHCSSAPLGKTRSSV